ncbi:AsnC family transcriptional regulator [Halanaeroarchaeum sulfurireducens]|uniref:ArsR family transcriptional regulator n=1 Tax=Halanaeroarchaeum sulfurireducens TaxID=1604004 RepID=A0A0F7PC27_9EURY|nr:AsnC family transcriptional regulator [Halanaeroarchaeum sulfurireducens]AKH97700.1 ArsR family transcriptional regulator [Halanaeroarchaeum sulfurireducens]ALG82095.1 ArsR family transcriptional regulator [Halanaeroarchaeum sulfurireducens]
MRDLDDTDVEILRLLIEDGRRPYREIADEVGLSAPAVSDRVTRLRDQGVIRRFTVALDREQLREGTPVLVTLRVDPTNLESVRQTLRDHEAVEHVFVTVESRLIVQANAPSNVREWLLSVVDPEDLGAVEVDLLSDAEWTPTVGATEFALTCDECGNRVTSEGVTARFDGEVKQFCCPSCEARYRETYEELAGDV